MSDIFEIHEMSEEDIKHEYITKALESKWDAKKISMETEIWKAVKKTQSKSSYFSISSQ